LSAALVIQHAKRMSRIILSTVACPSLPFFSSHYLINCKIFGKVTEHKVCFEFLYNLSENFLILSRIQRDITKTVYRSSCKVPFILAGF